MLEEDVREEIRRYIVDIVVAGMVLWRVYTTGGICCWNRRVEREFLRKRGWEASFICIHSFMMYSNRFEFKEGVTGGKGGWGDRMHMKDNITSRGTG